MAVTRTIVVLSAGLAVVAWGAVATAAPPSVGVTAQARAAGRIYKLADNSTYQHGCFDPCDCPLGPELNLRGTLNLKFGGIGDIFNFYEIKDVNWLVSEDGVDFRITGTGIYAVACCDLNMQWLELDLVVGDQPVQHFYSDIVEGQSLSDIDITVSVNGIYCLDTVLGIRAAPVPRDEIIRYRLGRPSTFQEGCWDPCDCILYEPVPVRGTFDLIYLSDTPDWFTEYAVVNVRWLTMSTDCPPQRKRVRGFGTYKIGGPVALTHQLGLDLTYGDEVRAHFDSGLIDGGYTFPAIQIPISMNGMECWDRVFDLVAIPAGGGS